MPPNRNKKVNQVSNGVSAQSKNIKKSPPKNNYSCEPCGSVFTSQRELVHHNQLYKTRHLKLQSKFRCEPCQRDFGTKQNLDQHNKTKAHIKKAEEFEGNK